MRREPAAELGDPDLDPEDVQPSVPLKKPAPSDLAATTPLSTSRLPTAGRLQFSLPKLDPFYPSGFIDEFEDVIVLL